MSNSPHQQFHDIVQFQGIVAQYLLRHRSILDVQSKLLESSTRVNRALAKSVTACGCISIRAEKQRFPTDVSLRDVRPFLATHIEGTLCEKCREVVETEIGNSLFYMAALCDLLGLDLNRVLQKELERVNALGIFNLT